MADILHDFPIAAPVAKVFQAVSTPKGLDQWWTKRSSGGPEKGATYELWFGPEYYWRAVVSKLVPNSEFELAMTHTDRDWNGTLVGFQLEAKDHGTMVRFHHLHWPEANEHYRLSCHCWAMYLRILRRYVEHGESVPYEDRLSV